MTDNQIFADFIGLKVRYFGKVLYACDDDGNIDFTGDAEVYCPDRDWNQLMPVVEKINHLQMPDDFDWDTVRSMHEWLCQVSINNVYADAVTIIKWYNENKTITK